MAIGTQNYTCGATGTYINVGAVAELFDLSCFTNTTSFAKIQDFAFDIWGVAFAGVTPQAIITALHSDMAVGNVDVLGQHYYVPNPLTGVGSVASLSAPTGTSDIDWVNLEAMTGELAQEIYQVDAKGGQPPATCSPGSDPIEVKYTAKYWLFGGTVKQPVLTPPRGRPTHASPRREPRQAFTAALPLPNGELVRVGPGGVTKTSNLNLG
ncbi:hypothetical protein BD779DRAFT_1470219 [Infundibulicybe gibba]|nr:hypothetical protein BD779DRAFT_1470219 [Infundibulicybe gibba]